MAKAEIKTDSAPAAIGPYSQAIITNDMVFVSGQLPVDIKTGELDGNGIEMQTRRSLENISVILEQAGLGMEHVVKTTVFLQDMKDFAAMNEVYTSYFRAPYPARSTIQVAALPKQALVEIEVIAKT